ncbi:helix-turn-helix domain-containing protein [Clostridium sp. D53t1_180928_C8]|uniref:helix-turn-helix transcriptional regulator n=1 Tax=Clostridium sp. D53t1_180928_C8 TaxID=2787101 RepID=UPI0018AC12E5|nr:helix-turn-helix domain-containing protein [Clostridium sp. D53t1_180928_C8]
MVKNKLKEIRMKKYMMEPKEFAEKIGVSLRSYYQYEDGCSRPKLEVALEIARKLNMRIDDIWYLE